MPPSSGVDWCQGLSGFSASEEHVALKHRYARSATAVGRVVIVSALPQRLPARPGGDGCQDFRTHSRIAAAACCHRPCIASEGGIVRAPVTGGTGAIGVVRSSRRGSEDIDEAVITCLHDGLLTTIWACRGVLHVRTMIRGYWSQFVHPRTAEALDGSVTLAIRKGQGSALAFISRCDLG